MFKLVPKVVTSSSFLDEKYHFSWSKTDFKPTSSLFFKCVTCIMLKHIWRDDQYVILIKYAINFFLIIDFLLQRWCYCQKRSTGNKSTNKLNFIVWLLQDSQNLNINENTYDNTNTTKHTHMETTQILFRHATQF